MVFRKGAKRLGWRCFYKGAQVLSNTEKRIVNIRDNFEVVNVPTHPKALKLLAFWNEHAANGIVVGRDIPSRPIADLLSSISIDEPIDDGNDYRVRLAGSSMSCRFGRDITGMRMSELFPPDEFQKHLATRRATIEGGKPIIFSAHLTEGVVEHLHLEAIHLPVLAPDGFTKWVLIGVFYFS